MSRGVAGPCAGLAVVEVAVGASELGLGLAGGVMGAMATSWLITRSDAARIRALGC